MAASPWLVLLREWIPPPEKSGDQHEVNSKHGDEWYAYLGLSVDDTVVAREYIESILLHLKFELAMEPAIVIGLAGVARLNRETDFWPDNWFWLYAVIAAAAAYFLEEAHSSAAVLARVREALLSTRTRTLEHGPRNRP